MKMYVLRERCNLKCEFKHFGDVSSDYTAVSRTLTNRVFLSGFFFLKVAVKKCDKMNFCASVFFSEMTKLPCGYYVTNYIVF